MRRLLLFAALAGCTYSEEAFQEDSADAMCSFLTDCYSHDLQGPCDAPVAEIPDHSCTFDPEKARQCVRGINQMQCPEADSPSLPVACTGAWDCS